MARYNRWAYMAHPQFNPPTNDCPECTEPSKRFHVGAHTKDGFAITKWECEHKHTWTVKEKR